MKELMRRTKERGIRIAGKLKKSMINSVVRSISLLEKYKVRIDCI
jgi:hypothetical protein